MEIPKQLNHHCNLTFVGNICPICKMLLQGNAEKNKMNKETIIQDTINSMNVSFEELKLKLRPVFNNKTEYVGGQLLKDCFKHLKIIILAHEILRKEYSENVQKGNSEVKE